MSPAGTALVTPGVVVRASTSQSVDQGFIPLVESHQKTLKMEQPAPWMTCHNVTAMPKNRKGLVQLNLAQTDSKKKKTLKMVSAASLLGVWHLGEVVENKPASSLVVSLGKALNSPIVWLSVLKYCLRYYC